MTVSEFPLPQLFHVLYVITWWWVRAWERPHTIRQDNIKMWIGLSLTAAVRIMEDRSQWRKIVHNAAKLHAAEESWRTDRTPMADTIALISTVETYTGWLIPEWNSHPIIAAAQSTFSLRATLFNPDIPAIHIHHIVDQIQALSFSFVFYFFCILLLVCIPLLFNSCHMLHFVNCIFNK